MHKCTFIVSILKDCDHHGVFFSSSSRAASLKEKKEANKMEKLQELKRTRDRKRGKSILVLLFSIYLVYVYVTALNNVCLMKPNQITNSNTVDVFLLGKRFVIPLKHF